MLESYTFYEAIHSRAYFASDPACTGGSGKAHCPPPGLQQSVKQLRFYARFIIVCLLMNKKEVRVCVRREEGGRGAGGGGAAAVGEAAALLHVLCRHGIRP